jgi:DNA-binding response OmpR family regulator
MKVLVVEDDDRLADVLVRGLRDAGHDVSLERDGRTGIETAMAAPLDAIVLDWMLPRADGPTVCRELRRRGNHTPILMLTARHSVSDRIGGLDAGADDYLTKPFAFDELLARLRVFARRHGHHGVLRVGDIVVDRDRRKVERAGTPVELTAREFDLLACLAERPGRVVERYQILDEVWDGDFDLRSNVIDVHIGKLRAKLDRPFGASSIETVRGIGFRLRDAVP